MAGGSSKPNKNGRFDDVGGFHLDAKSISLGEKFDSMLEILPEDLCNELFDVCSSTGGRKEVTDDSDKEKNGAMKENEGLSHVKPIDIKASQSASHGLDMQNGEIDNLWDFNVDEFMMTPNEHSMSDGATISQPNSLKDDLVLPLGDNYGPMQPAQASQQKQQGPSGWASLPTDSLNQFNLFDYDFQFFTNSIFSGATRGLTSTGVPEDTLESNGEDIGRPQQPGMVPRRSLIPLKSGAVNEEGHIPLSTQATSNAVKKAPVARQMSSSSLSSYRKGTNNNTNIEHYSKPQIQCFNCKTVKTPLWRRDPQGNTLCNACGLFQKLHGIMRPLSLKSDVIKKRHSRKNQKKNQAEASQRQSKSRTQSTSTTQRNSNQTRSGGTPQAQMQEVTKKSQNGSYRYVQDGMRKDNSGINNQQPFNGTKIGGDNFVDLNPSRLDSRNLMYHNRGMTSVRVQRKSRSDSSSSASSRSSSRQVVPILPKPSPTERCHSQENGPYSMGYQSSNVITSPSSSPRYVSSLRGNSSGNPPSSNSPLPLTGVLSSTGGGASASVSVPRMRSSRPSVSQSMSLMNQSLQQVQPNNSTQVSSSAKSSWVRSSVSPKVLTTIGATKSSPRSTFDLFSPLYQQQDDSPKSAPIKPFTSLLSQQLQQNPNTVALQPSMPESPTVTAEYNSSQSDANLSSIIPPASSPRHGYAASLQHQRGISGFEQQLRNSSSLSQRVSGNAGTGEQGADSKEKARGQEKSNLIDDLDWLRFGV
ncbi:HHL083Cp [Eremothecium sinecaudum]|uniref:HHL083Cp n=1 Tax=Eremothecium sinecaudum TaxID=45286 RepID=A0A0X8HW94_9SACH|nr:HHL083Cp [Eremothecium sinecaudum]AMD22687.1 HHL083Cp [Eremothecium sinecaudum]